MTPNELKTVTQSLAKLFASFPQSAAADVDLQIRSYLDAVKDYEAVDIIAAIDKFRRGECGSENHQFCPSTAQLCIETRERKLIREIIAKRNQRPQLVKA